MTTYVDPSLAPILVVQKFSLPQASSVALLNPYQSVFPTFYKERMLEQKIKVRRGYNDNNGVVSLFKLGRTRLGTAANLPLKNDINNHLFFCVRVKGQQCFSFLLPFYKQWENHKTFKGMKSKSLKMFPSKIDLKLHLTKKRGQSSFVPKSSTQLHLC